MTSSSDPNPKATLYDGLVQIMDPYHVDYFTRCQPQF